MNPLEALPQLVLEEICEYLALGDNRRRSLFAFSLTSRRCAATSTRCRFRRIHLGSHSVDTGLLERDLKQAEAFLGDRIKYVRHLRYGVSVFKDGDKEKGAEDDFDDAGFCRLATDVHPFFDSQETPESNAGDQTEAHEWEHLGVFIRHLPALADMSWVSGKPMPGCVIRALTEHHPRCRLRIRPFYLPSLKRVPGLETDDIDPDEYALITSPCLHAIALPYLMGLWDYSEEAILQAVATLAPKLQHVFIGGRTADYDGVAFQTIQNLTDLENNRQPWYGFHPSQDSENAVAAFSSSPPQEKGSLQSLVLRGDDDYSIYETPVDAILRWESFTDFSALSCLDIVEIRDATQALAQMAWEGKFQSLHTLRVSADEGVCDLLKALSPLRSLTLENFKSESEFDVILQYHGASLQDLHLGKTMTLSHDQIQRLSQSCPELQNIGVAIRRSGGNRHEVRVYEALGQLRKLKSASLVLQCSRPELAEFIAWGQIPWYDLRGRPADLERVKGIVRSCLIDAAIDESLARSIYGIIARSQQRTFSSMIPPLQRLEIRGTDTGTFPRGDMDRLTFAHQVDVRLRSICSFIARKWVCEPQYGAPEGSDSAINAREKSSGRIVGWRGDRDLDYFDGGEGIFRDIWTGLWPSNGGDWRDSWHSVPLAVN